MALRYNEDTQQVERERVEYDTVTRADLEAAVNGKQNEVDAAVAEQKSAQELLKSASGRVAQLEEELEELKSDLGDFDEVVPVPTEDVDGEAVDGVVADGSVDGAVEATPPPVAF